MNGELLTEKGIVHCHVGSLEMKVFHLVNPTQVHCHVGSLEMSVLKK